MKYRLIFKPLDTCYLKHLMSYSNTCRYLLPKISTTVTAEILHDHLVLTLGCFIYQQYGCPEKSNEIQGYVL